MFSLRIKPKINSLCRALSNLHMQPPQKVIASFTSLNNPHEESTDKRSSSILFTHRSIGLNIVPVNPMIPFKEIMDVPVLNKIVEMPFNRRLIEIIDGNRHINEIIEPPPTASENNGGIQAARLIIIRRKKMKKHKLKKLRKKMKFEWAKVRQRREMRKEKAFQANLIGQIKDAEKFSAEKYVADKIAQVVEVPIPRYWKGKRLPEFIIKQKLGLK